MTPRQRAADDKIRLPSSFYDPYDAMSDVELHAYMARLFNEPDGPTRSVTLRMPEALLSRLQNIASERHVPYQRLMKRMLEEAVSGVERRTSTSAHSQQRKPTTRPRPRRS